MKILSVRAKYPSRVMTNDDIIDLIRKQSTGVYSGDLETDLSSIKALLEKSGASKRHWLSESDSIQDLTVDACRQAISDAEITPSQLDIIIHAGVDRHFLEPGESHFIANRLGANKTMCFDVLDACNSWARAMLLAQSLMKAGQAERILIVTSEFGTNETKPIRPDNFTVRHRPEFEWKFPTFTVGDCATATVLQKSDEDIEFSCVSDNSAVELCIIPTHGFESFLTHNKLFKKDRFFSYGKALHEQALPLLEGNLKKVFSGNDKVDILFPHTSSEAIFRKILSDCGVNQDIGYFIYPRRGNVVSSSIPAAMSDALDEKRLSRGKRVHVMMGAAGLSVINFEFVF